MIQATGPVGSKFKTKDAPPSTPRLSPDIAAPIGVARSSLAAAVSAGRPRNRRERLTRQKRLRELDASTK